MTDINTWFTNNYPKDKQKELKEIHLFSKDLEGELTLKYEDFPELERIFYTEDVNIITSHDIWLANVVDKDDNKIMSSQPKGVIINSYHNVELLKYTSSEETLEKLYPNTGRGTIDKLNLKNTGLRGKLDLSSFTNLEEAKIELSHPWHLKGAYSNYITDLVLSASIKKLTLINNPVQTDLKIFETLTKLKELNISQDYDNSDKWIGSLNSLIILPLKKLNITNNKKLTDYDKLPKTITNLKCKGLSSLYEQIKPFAFDVLAWKIVNCPNLVETDKPKLIKLLNNKLEQSHKTIKLLNEKGLTDDNLVSQIELLEVKNRELA